MITCAQSIAKQTVVELSKTEQKVFDRLKDSYPEDMVANWIIYGEDNGGSIAGTMGGGFTPLLGSYSGTYKECLHYAVKLPGFCGWGYGGWVTK